MCGFVGIRFLKISSMYFVLGVVLEMVMGIKELAYQVFPRLSSTKWANVHFWLQNVGLPIMLLGLIMFGLGNMSAFLQASSLSREAR